MYSIYIFMLMQICIRTYYSKLDDTSKSHCKLQLYRGMQKTKLTKLCKWYELHCLLVLHATANVCINVAQS
jgi:hypothetical protein